MCEPVFFFTSPGRFCSGLRFRLFFPYCAFNFLFYILRRASLSPPCSLASALPFLPFNCNPLSSFYATLFFVMTNPHHCTSNSFWVFLALVKGDLRVDHQKGIATHSVFNFQLPILRVFNSVNRICELTSNCIVVHSVLQLPIDFCVFPALVNKNCALTF